MDASRSQDSGKDAGRAADKASFVSQLGPLLFLTTIFFINFVGRIVPAPLLPSIETDLGIAHAEAGSFFLLTSMGYFIALLCSGFVSSRLNHRRTIVLSAVSVGGALICVSLCHSLWIMRAALFVVGMSAGIYLPSGIAALTSLIDPRHWGKAIAVHELAPNLGFVAAPLLAEAFMIWFSWRGVIVFLGVSSIMAGAAFHFWGRGGDFPGESPNFGALKNLFAERAFWIMAVLFCLGICGTLGIYTMLPLYLVIDQGFNRNWANTLVALSRIPSVFMALVAGWLSDRFGPRMTIASVFLITGLLTILLGTVSDAWIVALVFLQPVIAACFFPPGFAALSAIGPPSARNVSVSLTIPAAFVFGGGAIPMGIGMMADMGFFDLGIALTGLVILAGFILALFLKPGRSNSLAHRPS
ncbi:MAG: MFS transporter [Deltaproteobacteria bacterium]|nr:MFS transporter [Deltaproteobacteria bacterium]